MNIFQTICPKNCNLPGASWQRRAGRHYRLLCLPDRSRGYFYNRWIPKMLTLWFVKVRLSKCMKRPWFESSDLPPGRGNAEQRGRSSMLCCGQWWILGLGRSFSALSCFHHIFIWYQTSAGKSGVGQGQLASVGTWSHQGAAQGARGSCPRPSWPTSTPAAPSCGGWSQTPAASRSLPGLVI